MSKLHEHAAQLAEALWKLHLLADPRFRLTPNRLDEWDYANNLASAALAAWEQHNAKAPEQELQPNQRKWVTDEEIAGALKELSDMRAAAGKGDGQA